MPIPLTTQQAQRFACLFLLKAVEERTEKTFESRLTQELVDIVKGQAKSIIQKQDMHKKALENRAFAHFRW